jgi:hypothetical protein
MALGLTELIDEVKAAIGRDTDTTLITDTRVLRWLNKAQEDIAEKCPGLTALDFKNTTSVDFTDGQLEWPLSDWTSGLTSNVAGTDNTTSNRICHLYGAYFSKGARVTSHTQFSLSLQTSLIHVSLTRQVTTSLRANQNSTHAGETTWRYTLSVQRQK